MTVVRAAFHPSSASSLWQAGRVDIAYDPHPDGRPDPGEVVWTWVPYEEDPTQGKDRPVLIVARQGESLVAHLGEGPAAEDHPGHVDREAVVTALGG